MSRNNSRKPEPATYKDQVKEFQKNLVSYVLMLIFFAFLFLRTGVPRFVFFIIAIPWTISLIHKAIDIYHSDKATPPSKEDEEWDMDEPENEQQIHLDDFKELRKEWKDSDFV